MHLLTTTILTVKVLTLCAGLLSGRKQSVAVSGRLECNGKPASDVKVKLYDKEISTIHITPNQWLDKLSAVLDYKLDQGKTDETGSFYLRGSKKEVTNIDPKVNIYHKCNYDGPCFKKFDVAIPESFITPSNTPQSVFNIGTINLAGSFSGESIDCLN